MKIVRVTYTTSDSFASQNKSNIEAVMHALRIAGNKGINYNACMAADGKTFTHLAFFQTDEEQKALNEIAEFKHFQEQLKASSPEQPPKAEILNFVGSSQDIFPS
jgi:hypothetical protein